MTDAVLYDYWRSSASYRVRIALNTAGIDYRAVSVDLVGGAQRATEHLERNPQGLVPALEIDGLLMTQSLAMIEYIDETRGAGFLPDDAASRSRVRALAQLIAMEIHPVCNLNVVNRVVELSGGGEAVKVEWMQHFIRKGLAALELLLGNPATSRFCHGDRPSMADFCLMPQIYNADRWGADITDLKRIAAIRAECEKLPAFQRAHPDAVKPG